MCARNQAALPPSCVEPRPAVPHYAGAAPLLDAGLPLLEPVGGRSLHLRCGVPRSGVPPGTLPVLGRCGRRPLAEWWVAAWVGRARGAWLHVNCCTTEHPNRAAGIFSSIGQLPAAAARRLLPRRCSAGRGRS